ncbi:MAG: hypothetical protein AAFY37_09085 [Pseudomonadota bacterium]
MVFMGRMIVFCIMGKRACLSSEQHCPKDHENTKSRQQAHGVMM